MDSLQFQIYGSSLQNHRQTIDNQPSLLFKSAAIGSNLIHFLDMQISPYNPLAVLSLRALKTAGARTQPWLREQGNKESVLD